MFVFLLGFLVLHAAMGFQVFTDFCLFVCVFLCFGFQVLKGLNAFLHVREVHGGF